MTHKLTAGLDADPRVPTWNGEQGATGLKAYEQEAKAYIYGLKDDEWQLAAPRLWSNLRGQAKLATKEVELTALRDKKGIDVLILKLKSAFPETAQRACREPMRSYSRRRG